jgi:hypothetical protein
MIGFGVSCVSPAAQAITPSVPVAPMLAAVILSRIAFGINAARVASSLAVCVAGYLSFHNLANPGAMVWMSAYIVALIGNMIDNC